MLGDFAAIYRLAIIEARPRGLEDEELDEWIDEHDGLEESIGQDKIYATVRAGVEDYLQRRAGADNA